MMVLIKRCCFLVITEEVADMDGKEIFKGIVIGVLGSILTVLTRNR